jgi:hypothetical protein
MIIRQPPLSEPEVACSSGKRFLRARPAIPPAAGTKLAGLRKFLQEVLADYLFLYASGLVIIFKSCWCTYCLTFIFVVS